jgi:hypothetical protein
MTLIRTCRPSRRALLRGALGGMAATVGLPLFDGVLNDSGTAFAAGAPLPVRFGTWFWGLGHTPGRGIKALADNEYRFIDECVALEPFRARYVNYFSGFNTPLDGAPSRVHYTGWVAARTGSVPVTFTGMPAPTLDTLIADRIGAGTRFRSLQLSSTGNPKDSYSYGGAGSHNAAEVSPLQLYVRVFGPEFRDPRSGPAPVDPRVLLRQSVLSAVSEERKDLIRDLGAADRARLDQYFTSVRELENQLEISISGTPPLAACRRPASPQDKVATLAIEDVQSTHDTLARLLVLALTCDQTRVFNMLYSQAASEIRAKGTTFTHHILSHEEPMDVNLGYKVQTAWFNEQSIKAFARMLTMMAEVKEGDGTLLDHTLILAQTDTSDAKTHSVIGIPSMTVGRAGGRIKTGLNVIGNSGPISRVGFTAMRLMGVPLSEWGTRSLRTSAPISEIVA